MICETEASETVVINPVSAVRGRVACSVVQVGVSTSCWRREAEGDRAWASANLVLARERMAGGGAKASALWEVERRLRGVS